MKIINKSVFIAICFCILFALLSSTAFANSAEPPRLLVIVAFPPEDLTLSLRFGEGNEYDDVTLKKYKVAWEATYKFTYGMVAAARPPLDNVTLIAESDGRVFEYLLPASMLNNYNNIVSLNFDKQTVSDGQTLARRIVLVSMRVILTLLIEGLVFFVFGYRQKRSWVAFFIINLLTQGALNIALNMSFSATYLIIGLVAYEILIIIFELFSFIYVIKEHKKSRAAAYVVLANLLSLVLGGVLITFLPV